MKSIKLLAIGILALLLCQGCATGSGATGYVGIDDGVYPTFYLRKAGDPGNVKITTSKAKIAEWKAAIAAYEKAQREIGDLVDYYQPIAIDKKRITKKGNK